MLERQNPYSVTVNVPVPLHNMLTKQAVDQGVAPRLLNCLQNGKHVYCSYRLVEKTKKISTTISKRKLPQFNEQPQKTPTISMKEQKLVSSKDMAEAHRSMDIAKERSMSIRQILSHDVLSASPLFDGDLPAHVKTCQ